MDSSREREKNMRRIYTLALSVALAAALCTGCGSKEKETTAAIAEEQTTSVDSEKQTTEVDKTEETTGAQEAAEAAVAKLDLEDGDYLASFETDSNMFHINEEYNGQGKLTVKDGVGVIHIVMPSQQIQQLFLGTAEDAQKEGAELIDHTLESVTYSDGLTEEVCAFDVPVPVIGEEFDLALIGKKEKWYDHKVKVENPVPRGEENASAGDADPDLSRTEEEWKTIEVSLSGGSGKATVESPAPIMEIDGGYKVRLVWSSPHYDYMLVDGVKYLPVNTEGNSEFEIPLTDLSTPKTVIADTVAMSEPHEIEYVLTFDESSLQ